MTGVRRYPMSESTDFSAIETRELLSYESKEREKKRKGLKYKADR